MRSPEEIKAITMQDPLDNALYKLEDALIDVIKNELDMDGLLDVGIAVLGKNNKFVKKLKKEMKNYDL